MTKTFLMISILTLSASFASAEMEAQTSLTDVVAPSTFGDPASNDRLQGMIYYDATAGQFKGIDGTGNAKPLSSATNSDIVISRSQVRIEVATVSNNGSACSLSNNTGGWSVARTGTGVCQVTFNNNFGAAPTCLCSADGSGSANRICHVQSESTSGVTLSTANATSGTVADFNSRIMCLGLQ